MANDTIDWRASALVDGAEQPVDVAVETLNDGVSVVEATLTPSRSVILDRISVTGETNLEYTRRLVEGYDSWAYSGVRDDSAGASFWDALFVADDGRALAIHALDATRLCTRIASDGPRIRVDAGATPPLTQVPGTWGYEVGEPPGLGLRVEAGTSIGATFAVAAGDDALALGERLAAIAATRMHARAWPGPPILGWESWYHYGLLVSADDVLANARILRDRYADRTAFDLVQIDDGWQRTYGAWWPNERFPDDLSELVTDLRTLGCRAGLWIAPFRVQPDAPGVATDHADWCLRDDSDAPLYEARANTWALDASRPEACEWIRDLGAQVRSWGFDMVKVDFCYLAALEARRHDDTITGIEALRRGMRALVDGLGDDVYVLGCGMPTLPAVGLCHGNRVGHDLAMPRLLQDVGHPVDDGWTGWMGVRAQARNVAARWAHAGRWYDADPEVVMAWGGDGDEPAGYPTEQARVMATLAAVVGGPFLLADDLAALTPDERAVLENPRLLDLVAAGLFQPVDLFARTDPATVVEQAFSQGPGIPSTWVAERGDRRAVAWFNWTDQPAHHLVPDGFQGPELWTGAAVGADIDVPPRAVRVRVT